MENELTIKDIFKIIGKNYIGIVVFTAVVVIATSLISYLVLDPTFTASTSLYVLNQQNSETVTSSDLSASTQLVNDYRELVLSKRVKDATARALNLPDLSGYDISVSAVSNTRFIRISVTGTEGYMAANIANELAAQFALVVVEIMRVDNVSIVDPAVVPQKPSGPQTLRNIAIAGVAGLALSIGFALAKEMLDTTIRTPEDVEAILGLPTLAQVPQVESKLAKGALHS